MEPTSTRARFDETKIDAIFAGLDQCHKPGAAVAIAIDGVPVYRKGFGLANIELPVVLGPDVRMRIGSTTKHFVCLLYMLLCEEGKAGLDDPIETHVPEIHPVAHGVTMRQLMTHTSGLRDVVAASMMFNGIGQPVTDAEFLELYARIDDVDFQPLAARSYNNGGYILLTAAIERLTGQPLDAVLRERIFGPVGMADTMLRRWDSDFVPNSATLHMIDQTGRYTRDYMGMEISGMGGMVATMDDMLLWLKHMDDPVVGSAATWQLMREPLILSNGASTGYGLGLATWPYRGVETLSHGGGVLGGNSQMIKVPSAGLDISIAVNRADASGAKLANDIIDLLVEGLEPAPPPAEGAASTCTYRSPSSGRIVALSSQAELQLLSVDGGPALPVKDVDGRFELPAELSPLQTSFAGDAASGTLREFGVDELFEIIEVTPDVSLGDHAGHYEAAAYGITAEVAEAGEDRRLTFSGPYGLTRYALTPLTAEIWRAVPKGAMVALSAIVVFDTTSRRLDFTAGRLQQVPFRRVEDGNPS